MQPCEHHRGSAGGVCANGDVVSVPPASIITRLAGDVPAKPFAYFDKGSMATIAKYEGVASREAIVGQMLYFSRQAARAMEHA